MPLRQLGVFIDNKPGSLSKAIAILDNSRIKILALSIVDTGEFGLLRLILDDPEQAIKIFEDANFTLGKSRINTEVTSIIIDEKNNISRVTEILGNNNINIDYAYLSPIQKDGRKALIIGVKDTEKTEKILKENDIGFLSLDDLDK